MLRQFRLVLPAVVLVGGVAAAPAAQASPPIVFRILGTNTAVAPNAGPMADAGDSISVTGGGTFDPISDAVTAGGTFVHYAADGTVRCAGTWRATALTGWTDFGRGRNALHGGVVTLTVTHNCATMNMQHTGIPMSVTSTLNAPSGSYTPGTTVGEFTRSTAGRAIIVGG